MIAAVGKNLELGKDNHLLWHLKEDLAFFRKQTMNKPIVMGRKTFESLPRLLPGRKHIVLTTSDLKLDPEVIIVHSKEELLDIIASYDREVMIIGGASIYTQMLEYSDKLVLTEIDQTYSNADAFFPQFDKKEWSGTVLSTHEENGIKYKHLVYTKKS